MDVRLIGNKSNNDIVISYRDCMKKAYYIDTYSVEHIHEMYDASSLKMFAAMYDKIEYRASLSSYMNVRILLGNQLPETVRYKSIWVGNGGCFLLNVVKQFAATLVNVFYIIKAGKNVDTILNYNTAMALRFINVAAKISKGRVLVVCHGEMQDIVVKRKTSPLFKWGMSLFKDAQLRIAEGLYFAVLGNVIRENVKNVVSPQAGRKVLSFDHTAIFDKIPLAEHDHNNKLVLGMIGSLRESKGFSEYMNLASHFKNNPMVEFRAIGKIWIDRCKIEESGIVLPKGVGYESLTRQKMYDMIREVDYVVYLFPKEGYRFTASGSIFDAIDCERPILSLYNDYFSGLFGSCGHFGYLENTMDNLINRIDWLCSHKDEVTWNMRAIKEKLQPENAAERFVRQWAM